MYVCIYVYIYIYIYIVHSKFDLLLWNKKNDCFKKNETKICVVLLGISILSFICSCVQRDDKCSYLKVCRVDAVLNLSKEKTYLINQKLDPQIKSFWGLIFKVNKFSSMSFRHTHCLGYKNMLKVHIFEKVSFLLNVPKILTLDHIRYALSNAINF